MHVAVDLLHGCRELCGVIAIYDDHLFRFRYRMVMERLSPSTTYHPAMSRLTLFKPKDDHKAQDFLLAK